MDIYNFTYRISHISITIQIFSMQKSLITRLSKQCNYNSQTLPIISNYESSISMSFSERSSEIDTTRENMPDISSSQSIHNVTIDFQSNTCKPIKLCFVVQVYVRVLFLRQKSYSNYSNNLLEANKRPTKWCQKRSNLPQSKSVTNINFHSNHLSPAVNVGN